MVYSHLGDNDAMLVLLLIPRLMAKCELLMTQVRDKVRVQHFQQYFPTS